MFIALCGCHEAPFGKITVLIINFARLTEQALYGAFYDYVCVSGYLSPLSRSLDGHFPLNISKIHVETDHHFLDETELDTLIR